jgi:Zn-finger nucleic acid-binding protein
MLKCPKCGVDSAMHRATVRVCPECGRILDAEELFRLLKELGVSEDTIEKVKNAFQWKRILS